MKKSYLLAAAAICTLAISSCESPSDYRPGRKVSVDEVPPGERRTYNVSDAAGDEAYGEHDTHGKKADPTQGGHKPDVMPENIQPNHDPGANEISDSLQTPESTTLNNPDSLINR